MEEAVFGKYVNALLTSVTVNGKDDNPHIKFKIEAVFDYDTLADFDANMHAYLTLFDYPTFDEMKFKNISSFGTKMILEEKNVQQSLFGDELKPTEIVIPKFTINETVLKIVQDKLPDEEEVGCIPTLVFSLEADSKCVDISELAYLFKKDVKLCFEKSDI